MKQTMKEFVVITALALLLFPIAEPQDADRTVLMKQLENVGETSYVRHETVDRFEDLALTPFWNLTMAEGETVQLDCGVYTAGQPGVDIHWSHNNTDLITDDR